MNVRGGTRLKFLLFGFLLPIVLIFLAYYGLVTVYFDDIFKYSIRSMYFRTFFERDLPRNMPTIDLLILGDSTARASVNPLEFESVFAVNLGVNGGTALSAYHVLDRYNRTYGPPKCVMYISQYNWKRNYNSFFTKVVFYQYLNWENIKNIWEIGVKNGVFPATDYSKFGFFTRIVRTWLYIDELPLNLIQEAYFQPKGPDQRLRIRTARLYVMRERGYQSYRNHPVLPESHFFNDNHVEFLNKFEPYETEDFYLQQLGELAEKTGTYLFYAFLPVAEDSRAEEVRPHIESRNEHIKNVLSGSAMAVQIPLPLTLPRQYFYDFSHMNADGAKYLRTLLEPHLEARCKK